MIAEKWGWEQTPKSGLFVPTVAGGDEQIAEETGVLILSDTHYGKKTASYNAAVFRERMGRLLRATTRIRALLTGQYRLTDLRVFLLGDMVDGANIYPTQQYHQEIQDPLAQVEELSEFLQWWLLELKRVWGGVEVHAVPGNHGRVTKFHPEQTNWDMALYRLLQERLEQDVPVRFNGTKSLLDPFIKKVDVRGHQYLLYHGAGVKMFKRVPWYGLEERAKSWAITGLRPFEEVVCGHFHTTGTFPISPEINLRLNGTLVTDDQWSLQELGREGINKFWFFGVGDRHAPTWEYELRVT